MFTTLIARIAQLVANWLGTGEVPGSNPGKGKNFSMKINIDHRSRSKRCTPLGVPTLKKG